MQTRFTAEFLQTPAGRRVNQQLRACVHCGFCNATCPTFQLTGNELDGPRGRIYLLQSMLEGNQITRITQTHLDRCLGCLGCETTCPSGVRYNELLEYGREYLQRLRLQTRFEKIQRWLLRNTISSRRWFRALWTIARLAKPLLPKRIQPATIQALDTGASITPSYATDNLSSALLLQGCVQSVSAPHVNQQLEHVLTGCGVQCHHDAAESCCGAIHFHNGDPQHARKMMRSNMIRWVRLLNQGTQHIVIAASGCAQMIRQYAQVFADEPDLRNDAMRISSALIDAGQLLQGSALRRRSTDMQSIAFHAPCTLQHGLRSDQPVRDILSRCGYDLVQYTDAHLCCGSAGTYSILQPQLAEQLKQNKLAHMMRAQPQCIATANIGCQMHLQIASRIPVIHWIELIEPVS